MATYIALLRGINVGGNSLKMERLREICGELGFRNPRTYAQSGNMVFVASGAASKLEKTIEEKLLGETRLPVAVVVRSAKELKRIAAENPFLGKAGVDESKLHVTFLAGKAPKEATVLLESINSAPVAFAVAGKEIYLHCPENYGEIKLSNNAIEKKLGLKATTRNWNTVKQLCEMAG